MSEEEKLKQVKAQVDSLISQSGLNSSVVTKVKERELVISFTDNVFLIVVNFNWQLSTVRAANSRVDIVTLNSKFSQLEISK